MSHYYTNDECDDCHYYVRQVFEPTAWHCIQCDMHELEGMVWNRYELSCGHEVHVRCYRTWCKTMEKVGCVQCGLLEKTEENKFCTACDEFHHSTSYHAIQ